MLNLKILLIIVFIFNIYTPTFAYNLTNLNNDNYEAVVLGTLIKKKVFKENNFYLTQYTFKTKTWISKKENLKERKTLKVNVLGADLEKKGLLIKTSETPNHIPLNEDVILFLEKTKSNKKHTYAIRKNGILYGENIKDYVK